MRALRFSMHERLGWVEIGASSLFRSHGLESVGVIPRQTPHTTDFSVRRSEVIETVVGPPAVAVGS